MASAALGRPLAAAYAGEIIHFLKHCKTTHSPATLELARQYLETREAATDQPARDALRWFFRNAWASAVRAEDESGSRKPSAIPSGAARLAVNQIPPAANDLGSADWERALIRTARERGLLWRTEQTYREWDVRFARFLTPRSPHAASGIEVTAFLSELAVRGRASAATQRQALNALVFLMPEALHRDLGKLEFAHAPTAGASRPYCHRASANHCSSNWKEPRG